MLQFTKFSRFLQIYQYQNYRNMSVIFIFSQSSSSQIPYTMNKSLHQNNRRFGQNLKNNLTQNDIEAKLALKTRSRKTVQFASQENSSLCRPQMEYFDDAMKYALTSISYPYMLKGPQKIKRDIEKLLHQVTQINGHNCIWHQTLLNEGMPQNSHFLNQHITLQKRTSLVDWIITIHKRYKLRQQTLHMTIKLIDDYCIGNAIHLQKYQLLGTVALFMAAKYQQIELPLIKDYYRFVQNLYDKDQFLQMESQILYKSQFSLSKKITTLWYLQAFAIEDKIFAKPKRTYKKIKRNDQEEDKQNLNHILSKQVIQEQNDFQKYMNYCRYILNLLLIDYKSAIKFKQDILAISTLIYVSVQRQFYSKTDGKSFLKFFVQKKHFLIEQNESQQQIGRAVKKCMKKIEKLHESRFQNRFYSINEKFNIDIKQ